MVEAQQREVAAREEAARLQKEKEEQDKTIGDLKDEARRQRESASAQLTNEQEVVQLNRRQKATIDNLQTAKRELEDKITALEKIQEDMQDASKNIGNAQDQVLKSSMTGYVPDPSLLGTLQTELANMTAQRDSMEEDKAVLVQKISSLEDSKKTLDNRLILLSQELDNAKMDFDAFQNEREEQEAREGFERSPSPSPASPSAAGDGDGQDEAEPSPKKRARKGAEKTRYDSRIG